MAHATSFSTSTTSDGGSASGHAEPRASRLVVVGVDRSKQLSRAKRHTLVVRSLRLVLPLLIAGSLAVYVAVALGSAQWTTEAAIGAIAKILPENLTMKNPHYEGFTGDGGSYHVRARNAKQDLTKPGVIELDGITGELTDAKKTRTDLTAARGTFETATSVLNLAGGIDIASADGMRAKLLTAVVNTKTRKITSEEAVEVVTSQAEIRSNRVEIDQGQKTVRFHDDVRTLLIPQSEGDAGTAAATGTAGLIGSSDAPTDIRSAELRINREQGQAHFKGQVRAQQADQSLQTEVLEVAFEPPADGQDQSSPGSRVKTITAPGPVILNRGAGEQITGQSALFDIANDKAVIAGNVVMTAGEKQRAVSDRAEFSPKADSILLLGNVVVTQGDNVLRGTRLSVDRKAGTSRMTAPGANPARIFARMVREPAAGAKPAAAGKADTPGKLAGAFSATTFRSDPGAPTDIVADALDIDDGSKNATFTGSVQAEQGKLAIQADKITAFYSGQSALLGQQPAAAPKSGQGSELTRIRAAGNVFISSKVDGQSASGDWADIDMLSNTVKLGGDVVLNQGKNVIRATALSIDMKTGNALIESAPSAAGAGWASTLTTKDGKKNTAATVRTDVRGGRPSAVFYPTQFGKQGAKPETSDDSGSAVGKLKAPQIVDRPAASSSWEANTQPGR